MSAISSLIRRKAPSISPSEPSMGVGVVFDAILQEIDTRESQIASYATESSLYGNDHTVHKNPVLQLRIAVSDNAFKVTAAQASSLALESSSMFSDALKTAAGAVGSVATGMVISKLGNAAVAAVGLASEASISAFAMSNRRSVDVFNALEKWRVNAITLNIVGTKRDYLGYRITRIREVIEKDVECGGVYDLTLEKPRVFSTVTSAVAINQRLRSNDESSTRGQAVNSIGQVGVSSES